jgi:phosphoribosylaminoimidazole-succinocarboxamide synthase
VSFEKGELVYEGKAKKIFKVQGHEDLVWVDYKDSLTAFNAQKKSSFENKGKINKEITEILFEALKKSGVPHHLVASPNEVSLVCKKVKIIPLEVVVRNVLAGSTAKKLGIEEGTPLEKPLVEFYFKDDALADPFVSDDQALAIKAAKDQKELDQLKQRALQVNACLLGLFKEIGLRLIDFKIELGKTAEGEILLADEITPDTCRLWDEKTGEKMDKDRFRRDLGNIRESYEEVLKRLKAWREKQ